MFAAALLFGLVAAFIAIVAQDSATSRNKIAATLKSETAREAYTLEPATKEACSKIFGEGIVTNGVSDVSVDVAANEAEVGGCRDLDYELPTLGGNFQDGDFPDYDSKFNDYSEMTDLIHKAEKDHPGLIDVRSIGISYQGRDIWAAKISANPDTDEQKPEVLYVGGSHGREHLTVEMTLYLMDLYTDQYHANDRAKNIVDNHRIWIVFNHNPDGSEFDIRNQSYNSWRKNRQPNGKGEPVGTDLNRNFGYKWSCCVGSSSAPAEGDYGGREPFSAPENRAVRRFVNSRVVDGEQQIKTAITFHTYGECILHPYGYTYKDVPSDMEPKDHLAFRRMGQRMSETNGYISQQVSNVSAVSGSFVDWAYGRHGIFAYAFEMYPVTSNPGFYPEDESIKRETERNKQAALYLAEKAAEPRAGARTD